MGENEQGSPLRTVIVLGLIALICIVVVSAIQSFSTNVTFTTTVSTLKLKPADIVKNRSRINVRRKVSDKNYTDNGYLADRFKRYGHFSDKDMKIIGDHPFTSPYFDSLYLSYLQGNTFEGSKGYEDPNVIVESYPGNYYIKTPKDAYSEYSWNIASITTMDGQKYNFNETDKTHNQKLMTELFDKSASVYKSDSIWVSGPGSFQYVDMKQIVYTNGQVINRDDSMFTGSGGYASIDGAISPLAAYTSDGDFNSQIITSGLQKSLYDEDNIGNMVCMGSGIRLALRFRCNSKRSDPDFKIEIGFLRRYKFSDKKSFNELKSRHPEDWERLIK